MRKRYCSLLTDLLMIGFIVTLITGCKKDGETTPALADKDGNSYTTVTLGTQTWMAENLKTTKYNDGAQIPLITDAAVWSGLTTPGFQWYNNDPTTVKALYGALYNWYAVNTGKLCPTGWHVPTNAEWTTLTSYLLGEDVSGGKLKETGFAHWKSPNTDATNESGFTALPGGAIFSDGSYANMGYEGNWWTADGSQDWDAYFRSMSYFNGKVFPYTNLKRQGFSVRCLKDQISE